MMHNRSISSKGKNVWWSKLKSSFSSPYVNCYRRKEEGKEGSLCEKLNVNEEYTGVFRTESYMEIWSKVQVQLNGSLDFNDQQNSFSSSSPSPFYIHLLEPRQADVINIIKSSKFQTPLIDYFEASLEACSICESLLRGLNKTRSNHRRIKRVIKLYEEKDEQCHEIVLRELASYASLSNPLSNIINNAMIHDKYTLLLGKLTSRRRKIKRKEKLKRFYKKAGGYGLMIAYIVLAITLLALAVHSMVGLLGTPGLLLPFSMGLIKKIRYNKGRSLKINFLKHLGSQLDVAAKGIYIFINDFDTVGRLVTRLHDEVEHKREIAAMCVRNGNNHQVIREALRDIHMHEQGFDEQLQELEQHIYLCFLTINRSRRLVLQEILAPLN